VETGRRRRLRAGGAALLAAAWLAAGAARAADVVVAAPALNPDPGELFSVPITAEVGAAVLGGYAFALSYDPAVVHVVSVAGGSTPEFGLPPVTAPASFASGSTPFAAAQGSLLSPTGAVVVATVTFQAVGAAGTSSSIGLDVSSLVDAGGSELPFGVFPTSVLIGFDPALDPDGDGLTNAQELAAGTDFEDADSDDDGLDDGFEVRGGLDPLDAAGAQGAGGDPDGDGLSNAVEQGAGCDPTDDDGDGDGLVDPAEAAAGTDCALADSDGDGLTDGFEVAGGLDPLDDGSVDPNDGAAGDPDLDGLDNAGEQAAGTDPASADSDGDGLPDGFEVAGGLDPQDDGSLDVANGPAGDPDGDGLANAAERIAGTAPDQADSDGDTLPDGWEVDHGLDPLDGGAGDPANGASGDPDADGHPNEVELRIGSDPQDDHSQPIEREIGLVPGFQPLSYPLPLPPLPTSFDLIVVLAVDPAADLNRLISIDGIEGGQGPVLTTSLDRSFQAGPVGESFGIDAGQGVLAEVIRDGTLPLYGVVQCAATDLVAGVGVVGFPCLPPGYTARQLLQDLGTPAQVASVQRFDVASGRFETAAYVGGVPAGSDFPIQVGEAYLVHMLVDRPGFDPLD
jgi:hypothetical protein